MSLTVTNLRNCGLCNQALSPVHVVVCSDEGFFHRGCLAAHFFIQEKQGQVPHMPLSRRNAMSLRNCMPGALLSPSVALFGAQQRFLRK